jgi:D-3-phosphoglycerate dehydrogenase
MTDRPPVAIVDRTSIDHGTELSVLDAAGLEASTHVAADPEAVVAAGRGARALVVAADVAVPRSVFERLDALEVVARPAVGVENVALDAAREAGTTVVHVPDYCVEEVATHALALCLACLRSLPTYDRRLRAGEWDWGAGRPVRRLSTLTLGLVGFGRIGRAVAARAAAFGMDVLAADPYVSADAMAEAGVERVGFGALLDRADAVSIHAPLTDETEGLFDADALARLDDEAVLVNTARGGIVDEDALHGALTSGALGAAGLDVFAEEPRTDSPLFDLDSVVVSPHVAWYSEDASEEVTRRVAEEVVRVLRGDPPRNPVTGEWG